MDEFETNIQETGSKQHVIEAVVGLTLLVLAFFALDCVWTVVGFVQLGRGAAAHCAAQTPTLF